MPGDNGYDLSAIVSLLMFHLCHLRLVKKIISNRLRSVTNYVSAGSTNYIQSLVNTRIEKQINDLIAEFQN